MMMMIALLDCMQFWCKFIAQQLQQPNQKVYKTFCTRKTFKMHFSLPPPPPAAEAFITEINSAAALVSLSACEAIVKYK